METRLKDPEGLLSPFTCKLGLSCDTKNSNHWCYWLLWTNLSNIYTWGTFKLWCCRGSHSKVEANFVSSLMTNDFATDKAVSSNPQDSCTTSHFNTLFECATRLESVMLFNGKRKSWYGFMNSVQTYWKDMRLYNIQWSLSRLKSSLKWWIC